MTLKSKLDELAETREKLKDLTSKRGAMLHTSHQDPTWSEAKAFNWGKDIEKLQEKEYSLLDEISLIKHAPEFIKDLESKKFALNAKINKLHADLEKSQSRLFSMPGENAEAVLSGADPMKSAAEYKALQDKIYVIKLALEDCKTASNMLEKLGEDIPYRPAHAETVPANFKVEVPQPDQPARYR